MKITLKTTATWTVSFVAGLAVAVILHFMLYRMGIPLKPFVYVVF
jgi:hypothetical protein